LQSRRNRLNALGAVNVKLACSTPGTAAICLKGAFHRDDATAMDFGLILQMLVLLAVANSAPVVIKRIFGGTAAWPLDFDHRLRDGEPLLGQSKTIRGVVGAILCAAATAPLIGLDWRIGALAGAGAMAGDLTSSFIKRRLAMRSSSMARGLDQIPEALFGALAAGTAIRIGVGEIVIVTLVFFCGQVFVSRGAHAIGLRDEPY
jgi:CDP-2,3-bis-(O-geranylgeranyl)-sn-glycerol synthase